MKRITITGNLGKDAECREGQGGHKFVSFSVAYAERDTDAKDEQGNPFPLGSWNTTDSRKVPLVIPRGY